MFYLRPGNLFKDFWVEEKTVETTSRGRTTATFDQDNATHLLAVLAEGEIRITPTGGEDVVATLDGGFLSVEHDRVTVVSDTASLGSGSAR